MVTNRNGEAKIVPQDTELHEEKEKLALLKILARISHQWPR